MSDTIRVALLGNPNAGKSALFNKLTGARQKVANYPGVTVERVAGMLALTETRCGLVNAKLDSLRAQGELIANVLAEGASDGAPAPPSTTRRTSTTRSSTTSTARTPRTRATRT